MRLVAVLLLTTAAALAGPPEQAARKVVADYVDLYTAKTLPQWKGLFHPQMTAAHAASNGAIRVRNLEEFFSAQEAGFKEDPTMSEKLTNVQIFMGNRIARVTADYVFAGKGGASRGKLGLHMVRGSQGWKIVAVVFSYDE